MPSRNKVAEKVELQDVMFNGEAVSEAWEIEKVLDRAHQIHRAHGGIFGYDLEDWLQAERELAERNRPEHFQIEESTYAEAFPREQERNRQKCSRLNN